MSQQQKIAHKKSLLSKSNEEMKLPVKEVDTRIGMEDLILENQSLHWALEEAERKLEDLKDIPKHKIKTLKDQLSQSNSRLFKTQNTCTILRQELKKAQKILSSEIGDNVTIANLSSHLSGWKGRNEQIQQLQHKLNELQNKFNEQSKSTKSSSNLVYHDQRTVSCMKNFDKERRQHIENLEEALRQAGVALEDNKKKLEASRARIRVLENDLNIKQSRWMLLNEKKQHDDELINALNGQLRAVECRYRDRVIDIEKQRDKIHRDYSQAKNEITSLGLQVEQLRKKLKERETEIDALRLNMHRTESISAMSQPVSCKGTYEDSLVEIVGSIAGDSNEYVVMGLAAEAERQRLLELVTVLNQRLEKEQKETDNALEQLRRERYKNARLESKLQRLEAAMPGINTTGYKARFAKSLTSVSSSTRDYPDSEQMQLELLKEECLALKARLTTVQQDKIADLQTYKQMLHETREIFLNASRSRTVMSGENSAVTV